MTDDQFALGNLASSFNDTGEYGSAAGEDGLIKTVWTYERGGLAGLLTENNALDGQRSMVDDGLQDSSIKVNPSPSALLLG